LQKRNDAIAIEEVKSRQMKLKEAQAMPENGTRHIAN
jgi:hypothetical protein